MLKTKEKGFTLIEIMIAAGALAGLSVVLMSLTKQTTKSSLKFKFDTETNLTTNELIGILSSPSKCLSALGGKNAINTSSGITNINNQYYIFTHALAPANGYGNAGIKINSYSLNSTAADIASNVSYLHVIYQNKKILAGPSIVPKKIKLYIEVNASNAITACHSIASHSANIWSRGGGTSIFYPGKVGIGTTTPAYMLDIAGTLNSSSSITGASIMSSGNITASGSITGSTITSSGTVSATGTISGSTINSSGSVSAVGNSYASSFQYTSDKRFKTNIISLNDTEDIILKLRPVSFRWKKNHKLDFGFIAQEVSSVLPEITSKDEQKVMHVDYAKIIPFLVVQIQKQQKEINKLKRRVK